MPYLRHATESDATLIASFSEMVFNTSFPGLLDMGVSLEILRRFYNAQAISDGIKGEEVFLLLFNDLSEKELTGYVSVEPVNDGLWVLHKLYVSPAHHRRHIGSRLMDDALDYISRHIHNTVYNSTSTVITPPPLDSTRPRASISSGKKMACSESTRKPTSSWRRSVSPTKSNNTTTTYTYITIT